MGAPGVINTPCWQPPWPFLSTVSGLFGGSGGRMLSYLDKYCEFERIQRGRSSGTLDTYTRTIYQFHDWLASEGRDTNPEAVLSTDIQDFMVALVYKFKNLANSTRAQKLSALKSYFDFLINTGLLRANPADNIPSPRVPVLMPVKFTTKELAQLFGASSPDPADPWQVRDHAVLKVLYAASLRVSELRGLDLGHIKDSGRYIRLHITGKGAKQRIITLRANPAAALRAWCIARMALAPDTDEVFISRRGLCRLSSEAINEVLKKYARLVGINDAEAFVHKMRATGLADLYDSGDDNCPNCGHKVNVIDIYFLSAFAGHTTIETMKKYVNISDKVQKKGIPDRRFTQINKKIEALQEAK